jgi:hypothetical protein
MRCKNRTIMSPREKPLTAPMGHRPAPFQRVSVFCRMKVKVLRVSN